jgi:hypothetical protein
MATGTLNTVIGAPATALGAIGSVVGIGGSSNTASADTSSGCGSSAAAAAKPATTKPAGGTSTGGSTGGGVLPDVGGALKSILP